MKRFDFGDLFLVGLYVFAAGVIIGALVVNCPPVVLSP